jgi:phosphoglycolate phosphatase-like HAD superfamily hydrolase
VAYRLLGSVPPMLAPPNLVEALPRPLRSGATPAPAGHARSLPLPRVLLCDLDGTLIDTMPILADLATEVLEDMYGMPKSLGREMYLATSGLPFWRQLESICPDDPRNAAAADRFERGKPSRCRSARMAPDTRRVLGDLQARGVEIVVSSNNGVENVEAFASASDFPFDLVLGHDGKGFSKGRPHVDHASRIFGVGSEDMLFVGDSLHDGELAERENLRFVGVAGTFSKERFALRFPHAPVVERFSQISTLLF